MTWESHLSALELCPTELCPKVGDFVMGNVFSPQIRMAVARLCPQFLPYVR